MDHLEAIVKINNCIDKRLLPKLIKFIDHKAKKNLALTFKTNKDIRNVKGLLLEKNSPTNIFYWNQIQAEITRLYMMYKAKFNLISSTELNQIDLLKYEAGGKYNMHVDNYTTTLRTLSIIINLNDNYEGGDLVFGDQKCKTIHRLKLGAGDIVFFPSNFLYPHCIEPIKKGKRYSVVSWLV